MLPVITIVGRPNVGKSTLFNCLTRSRDALVFDLPGTTRDRIYGEGKLGSKPYIVIDTGGLGLEDDNIDYLASTQSLEAVNESDIVLFVVDARAGLTASDESVALQLRKLHKKVVIVANKIDSLMIESHTSEFYQLGFELLFPVSALERRGVKKLADNLINSFDIFKQSQKIDAASSERIDVTEASATETSQKEMSQKETSQKEISETKISKTLDLGIKIAVVGKPNVGKSTLVNSLLGQERVIVFDAPGTTRDSVYIPFERGKQKYTIIDTAGVRKRAKVKEVVEKFSIVKTLRAIEDSNVVLLVIDATSGITDQDLSLMQFILDAGKSVIIAINKWDALNLNSKKSFKKEITYKLGFVDYAIKHYISALHGTGVGNIFGLVIEVYNSATKKHSTNRLTQILQLLTDKLSPPIVRGRRIKLRYAHAGGYNPPKIVIHGNQTKKIPSSYQRYLSSGFRKILKIMGTPVQILFRTGDNPYKDRVNILTKRQMRKRKRQMRYVKKKKKK